jgi:hypothetical protein
MTREFCARINQAWGGNLVREVKFVEARGSSERIRHEIDNEHTPFIRRNKRQK